MSFDLYQFLYHFSHYTNHPIWVNYNGYRKFSSVLNTGRAKAVFVSIGDEFINCIAEESMAALLDLTEREIEILQLVLADRTNKAIAVELCISEKTVEFHLDNIYTKIGMRTRLMAGIWAIQQGLQIRSQVSTS
jgi:DNA-binding NarL/FixJ family response regulator